MSKRCDNIVKSGADKTEAEKQMRSIVKEYVENKKIEAEGKDPVSEKKKRYKDI